MEESILILVILFFISLMFPISLCISEIEIDPAVVAQLASMGFAYEGCKKAVYHTKNSGVEQAMNWVMEHMGDPGGGNVVKWNTWGIQVGEI